MLSGKFVLRILPELHQALKLAAENEKISLNEYCAAVLNKHNTIYDHGWELNSIISRFRSALGTKLIGLAVFGSRARGDHGRHSDSDLLVVLDEGERVTRDTYRHWDQIAGENSAVHRIEPHFAALPGEASQVTGLWVEAALDGIILWDPTWRLGRFFGTIRRMVADGQIIRKMSHGHPYWIHVEVA